MANFTPISAAIGGALIGLSAVLLMLFNGRIAGITGVFAGLIDPISHRPRLAHDVYRRPDRGAFVRRASRLHHPDPAHARKLAYGRWSAGLLVGFGTRLSNGCTSGHGICGIARLSPRSITATAMFMAAAIVVVAVTRHVIGG